VSEIKWYFIMMAVVLGSMPLAFAVSEYADAKKYEACIARFTPQECKR